MYSTFASQSGAVVLFGVRRLFQGIPRAAGLGHLPPSGLETDLGENRCMCDSLPSFSLEVVPTGSNLQRPDSYSLMINLPGGCCPLPHILDISKPQLWAHIGLKPDPLQLSG